MIDGRHHVPVCSVQQILGRMIDMVRHESSYREVAMIVALVVPYYQPFVETGLLGGSREFLGQKLPLLIKVVIGTLRKVSSLV